MFITFFVLIVVVVIIIAIMSPTENANDTYTEKKTVQIAEDIINIRKIEECAKEMRAKENITYNE